MNDFSLSTEDFVLPLGGALLLWLVSKAINGAASLALHLAKRLVTRQLRKIKRVRVDAFAIQKEIIKESTLFACFVLSSLLAMGFYLPVAADKVFTTKVAVMATLLVPPLLLEAWWLLHQDYVTTLLKYAAKLGPGFRRAIPRYREPYRRTSDRKARRDKSAKSKATYRHVVSRR